MSDAYHHGVFLSYPVRGTIPTWALDFATVLREELANLGLDDRVFVDRQGLHTGDPWPDVLQAAHHRSKVFVPVLCAPYFRSGWCVSEWSSAMARGALVGRKLVYPIWFNDRTEHDIQRLEDSEIQEQIRRTSAADFRELSYNFDPRGRTAEVREIRKLVRQLCDDMRDALERPPAWDVSWPVLPRDAVSGADPLWNARMTGEGR